MGIGKMIGTANGHGGIGYNYHLEKIFVMPLNQSAYVKWIDPCDNDWLGTKIVRKAGAYPDSVTDGVLVLDSRVRNQYAEDGFIDTGLTNGTDYYYKAFPYSGMGVNTSHLNQAVSIMPSTGLTLSWPDVNYTGAYRRGVVDYSGVWYYEWEMFSSGTMTVGRTMDNVDFYLVGGGGSVNQSSGGHMNYRAGGGGSGYPATLIGIRLNAAESLSIVVGGPQGASSIVRSGATMLTANPGAGTVYLDNWAGGAGYSGYYDLYNDPLYRYGQGSPGKTGGARSGENGKGGGGCTITALKAQVGYYGYATPSNGYGAGANAGSELGANSSGAQGVVLVRMPLVP